MATTAPPPERALDPTLIKPDPAWTREERISWAVAKWGADAPFYWNIYLVGTRGSRSKVTEVDGLNVESYEDALVRSHGGGTYFRQLMVRNVRNDYGAIVTETVNLNDSLGRVPVLNANAEGGGMVQTVSGVEERLARIERALDRFAGGMPAVAPTPDPAAQAQATMQLAMQMAQMMRGAATPPTPVEELLKVKALAEKLIERDEEREGGFGDYRELGRMLIGVVNGIREALPRTPSGASVARPQLDTRSQGETATRSATLPPPHPAPRVPATPTPVHDSEIPREARWPEAAPQSGGAGGAIEYLREPFPGCFDIVDAVKQRPELIPVTVGKDPAEECRELIELMFDKIEGAAGDPQLVANRLGARGIVDAFASVYPDAEPFRPMMERAAAVFVDAANQEIDDDEDAGSAAA